MRGSARIRVYPRTSCPRSKAARYPLHMKLGIALWLVPMLAPAQEPEPTPRPALEQVPEELRAPLRPYLEAAEGLEGLEQSLTVQVAMALGIARERKAVGREFRELSEHHAENWNEQIGALLEALGAEAGKGLAGGALHYDTGLEVDRATKKVQVLRKPEFRLLPDPRFAERFARRRLVAGMCSRQGLPVEDAERMRKLLIDETGELGAHPDPWLTHAHTQLVFMSLGPEMWNDYVAERVAEGKDATPFGSFDEFQRTLGEHVRAALVDPLRPGLAEEDRDRVFRYEGDVVLLVHAPDGTAWEAPAEIAAANAADHVPTLVVDVESAKSWRASAKHKRLRIGMVAGGAHRTLYDGGWPLH